MYLTPNERLLADEIATLSESNPEGRVVLPSRLAHLLGWSTDKTQRYIRQLARKGLLYKIHTNPDVYIAERSYFE